MPWLLITAAVLALVAGGTVVVVRERTHHKLTTVSGTPSAVLLARYSDNAVVLGDPLTGSERSLPGVVHNCGCQLVVRNGVIWGADINGAFSVKAPYTTVTRVDIGGGAIDVFPVEAPDAVYITKRISDTGGPPNAVLRIAVDGQPVGEYVKPPAPYEITDPPRSVGGGVLVMSPAAELHVWDPSTGKVADSLVVADRVRSTR